MGCGKEQETTVDLLTDVPRHTLVDPATDRVFKVKLKNGEATVALPNMATGRRLLDADSMTQAELFTAVLSGCLISINGMPSLGVKTAQSLGIVDREKIISELYARTPGPRLGEVSKACKACGNEINIPLSLAALFRV
jgi:hypothetical protein